MAWAMFCAPSGNRAMSDNKPMPMTKMATSTSTRVTPSRRIMAIILLSRWNGTCSHSRPLAIPRERIRVRVVGAVQGNIDVIAGDHAGAPVDGNQDLVPLESVAGRVPVGGRLANPELNHARRIAGTDHFPRGSEKDVDRPIGGIGI